MEFPEVISFRLQEITGTISYPRPQNVPLNAPNQTMNPVLGIVCGPEVHDNRESHYLQRGIPLSSLVRVYGSGNEIAQFVKSGNCFGELSEYAATT